MGALLSTTIAYAIPISQDCLDKLDLEDSRFRFLDSALDEVDEGFLACPSSVMDSIEYYQKLPMLTLVDTRWRAEKQIILDLLEELNISPLESFDWYVIASFD